MEVYLDNSATTPVYPEVSAIVSKMMTREFGNPSSLHRKGAEAENEVRNAKKIITSLLKCEEQEIYFTSGGTESNNWALIGAARANRRKGRHILSTPIEHPSVSRALDYLAEEGYEIELLNVDENGRIDLRELSGRIRKDTILVSVMAVNNETGTMQDLDGIAREIKRRNPDTLFHTDAVQLFGKSRMIPRQTGIDLMSVSAHKIHGPKGVGLLFAGKHAKLSPILFGGGQQRGMRSGTDNVPGIAGFAKACEITYDHLQEKNRRMRTLKEELAERFAALENIVINTPPANLSAPHILNASFLGVKSEVMLHALEDRGIYVSAGSACSSHKRQNSPVLRAMGRSADALDSAIRFSLSEETTEEEIRYTAETVRELLPVLRRYTRR